METPQTRYAKTLDGAYIAYQTVGDGPIDIVWQFDWLGNVDTIWEYRPSAEWFRGLALDPSSLDGLARPTSGLRPFRRMVYGPYTILALVTEIAVAGKHTPSLFHHPCRSAQRSRDHRRSRRRGR
jgi:hypothetical protein